MIRVSNKHIINAVAGTIYEMHPYHLPENFDAIINKFEEYFTSISRDNFVLCEFETQDAFYKWLKEFLMAIPEFTLLNVSKKLKDEGVNVYDDERNQGIMFTTRYDKDTKDKRYTDFIDLDACIRNIYNQVLNLEEETDCFLCQYAEHYGSTKPGATMKCEHCINNRSLKIENNYMPHFMSLKPYTEWTDEEKEKYRLN